METAIRLPHQGEEHMSLMNPLNRILSLVAPGPQVRSRVRWHELERMERELSDTFTTVALKAAFERDPEVRGAGIHVAIWRGVVQLSGFVESRHVIGRALAIARGMRDVSGVKNDMRLK
jgi:osmotically-inducible protein OsmY